MDKQNRLSTHRVIQLASLVDDLGSRARVSRRAASSAARINNRNATAYFLRRAARFERVAARARRMLEVRA